MKSWPTLFWLAVFCVGLILWTTGWILIDWVLNFAVYNGMEAPLWLFQVPFSPQVVFVSGWHAYQIAFWQCTAALIILAASLTALLNKFQDGRDAPQRDHS